MGVCPLKLKLYVIQINGIFCSVSKRNPYSFKRRNRRFDNKFPVVFDFFGSTRNGIVLNFSKTGLFIQCDTLPQVGQIVELAMDVDTFKELKMMGRVVWSRSGIYTNFSNDDARGIGVDLIAPRKEYLRYLEKLDEQDDLLNKRQETRNTAKHRVQYKSGLEFVSEYCEDLSKGGMYLATSALLKKGQMVFIRLELPDVSTPLEIEAKVAHTLSENESQAMGKPPGVGLQFLDLTPRSIVLLKDYLSKLNLYQFFISRPRPNQTPNKGLLKDFLLSEILIDHYNKKSNCMIEIFTSESLKKIFIQDGQPFFVESSLLTDKFLMFLYRKGVLQEDISKWIEDEKFKNQSDLQFRTTLLNQKKMDADTLWIWWVSHQEEKISNALTHFEGEFKILYNLQKHGLPINDNIKLLDLLMQSFERWYDPILIKAWMGLSPETKLKTTQSSSRMDDVPKPLAVALSFFNNPQPYMQYLKHFNLTQTQALPILFCAFLMGSLETI